MKYFFTKIKKAITWYLTEVFSGSKWYRKKKGGVWYCIQGEMDISGFAGNSSYWVNKLPEDDGYVIEKVEEYPK